MQYIVRGIAGLQGPFYAGTNTFHRRSAIYGLYPDQIQNGGKGLAFSHKHYTKFTYSKLNLLILYLL